MLSNQQCSPFVVGLVGHIGAGKDEIGLIIRRIMKNKSVFVVSYSMILKEILQRQGQPATREALQRLGTKIAKRRQWWLEKRMLNRILRSQADICVIAGLRTKVDANLIMSFAKHLIVSVETDQNIRYQRVKQRRKLGDGNTRTSFAVQGRAPIERQIKRLSRLANVPISNDGSLNDLEVSIRSKVIPRIIQTLN